MCQASLNKPMSQEPAHFATEPIETLVPNTIRTLASMRCKRQTAPLRPSMGCADFAFVSGRNISVQPANPHWPNRDRFVLSAGHGSC